MGRPGHRTGGACPGTTSERLGWTGKSMIGEHNGRKEGTGRSEGCGDRGGKRRVSGGGARRCTTRRSVAARANTRGREEPGREGKRQRGPWQLRDATRELGRQAGCCRRGALAPCVASPLPSGERRKTTGRGGGLLGCTVTAG